MWEPGSKQEALDERHDCQIGRSNLRLDYLPFFPNLLCCLKPDPSAWELMLELMTNNYKPNLC